MSLGRQFCHILWVSLILRLDGWVVCSTIQLGAIKCNCYIMDLCLYCNINQGSLHVWDKKKCAPFFFFLQMSFFLISSLIFNCIFIEYKWTCRWRSKSMLQVYWPLPAGSLTLNESAGEDQWICCRWRSMNMLQIQINEYNAGSLTFIYMFIDLHLQVHFQSH